MATLDDVARLAGVTPATVSNVITARVRVREETRLRVLAAIKELNYRPNLIARGLAQGRSYLLALLVTDIANSFYAEIAREVEMIARAHSYHLMVCNTNYDSAVGREYLDELAGRSVDGLLVMGGSLHLADVLDAVGRGQHLVLCNWEEEPEFADDASSTPHVSAAGIDFRRGGELAARHLLDLGHRQIAAIVHGSGPESPVHASRFRGFRTTLFERGLELQQVAWGDSSVESGYRAAQAILSSQPQISALFATNDLMAIGALDAAIDLGLRVPTDLSIIGFDDVALAAHVRPRLTTIGVPKHELATEAMELLLRGIDDAVQPSLHLLVRPHLIIRQSTASYARPD